MPERETVLGAITAVYLDSGDFNGALLAALAEQLQLDWPTLRETLVELVREERVGVLFADTELNPHILRLGFQPIDAQVEKLAAAEELTHACVYPRQAHLRVMVDPREHQDKPYTLALMLGEAQLAFRSFDLSVLETYRNDPRYSYQTNDICGSISVRDEYFESHDMPERDQVLLETFGFAYDSQMRRAVAVFLRYLAGLSPEHQQTWRSREVEGDFKLHPDYYRTSIIGDWPERESIFTAMLTELHIINKMAKAMGRRPLFRKEFGPYAASRPPQFTFLVRPTLAEFNNFILVLDKILSDNIDKAFFRDEVQAETEEPRSDGKVIVRTQGTLTMLDLWLRLKVRLSDWTEWNDGIAALREVRTLRQKPAHALDENVFDQKYLTQQRHLVIRVYAAVRSIRLLFANHCAAKQVKVPDWLYEGRIWTH
jgi:hypothetical protein